MSSAPAVCGSCGRGEGILLSILLMMLGGEALAAILLPRDRTDGVDLYGEGTGPMEAVWLKTVFLVPRAKDFGARVGLGYGVGLAGIVGIVFEPLDAMVEAGSPEPACGAKAIIVAGMST